MVGMPWDSDSCTIVSSCVSRRQGWCAEPTATKLAAGSVLIVPGQSRMLLASVLADDKIGDVTAYLRVGLSAMLKVVMRRRCPAFPVSGESPLWLLLWLWLGLRLW